MNIQKIKEYFSIVLLFVCFGGCSKSHGTNQRVKHPVSSEMPHNEVTQKVSPPDEISKVNNINLKHLILNINEAKSVFTLGGKKISQSDMDHTFGKISGVVVDSNDNIYVLDQRIPAIKKFDPKGELLYIYGNKKNKGKGPEDLFEPTDIEIGKDDHIYVLDRNNYIKKFIPTKKGLKYLTSFKTPVMSREMCLMNDKIFLKGIALRRSDGVSRKQTMKLVHVYSAKNGAYIQSFGEPYGSSNLRLSSGGKIGCIESSKMVVYSFKYFPQIYGYTASGKFKWVSKIEPFSGMKITETQRNGQGYKFEYGATGQEVETIFNIQPLKDDFFIVQTLKGRMQVQKEPHPKIISYIVSSKNGKGFYKTSFLSDLNFIQQKYIYYNNIDSIPGVQVFHYKNSTTDL